MDRRLFLQTGAAAAALGGAPAFAAPDARATYDRLLDAMLAASPETATSAGLDTGARAALRGRLDAKTYANRLSLYGPLLGRRAELAGLGGNTPRERAWAGTVRWTADAAEQMARFPYGGVGGYAYPVPYVVSQLTGDYLSVPDFLASQQPVETRADAEAYLARLADLPVEVDRDTAAMQADAKRGVVPPSFICDRALSQLADLRRDGVGLARPLVAKTEAKGIAGDWGKRAAAIVDGSLAAALDRQIAAVTALKARAKPIAGVGAALPDGQAYYAMCLRFQTSTSLTPDAAHRLGLDQVAMITAEADKLLRDQGHRDGTVAQRITALGKDPAQLWPNTDAGRAELLASIRARVADIERRLPEAFRTLPKTPLEVRRVPVATELGAPGAYSQSGSIDGTRPGAIYFNLHDTANWPKWGLPTTVYHEGLPGHHLAGSIANEATDTPTLLKLLGTSAYNEGWALYAEQLADEMGVYADMPLGRLGRLQQSLFRACRIVVDTGMHAFGWSREKAIAYLIDNAGSTPEDSRREIERYVVWPGQACAYKIGHLEFLRLREKAKAKLGSRFDLRAFHDTVLLPGSMPLEVMAHVVDDWIASA